MAKSSMDAELKGLLERYGLEFESALRGFVAAHGREGVPNLHDAMAYALGSDIEDPAQRGKRIRPALCLLTAEALGAPAGRAMPFALCIELMHNFALVHDDMEDGDIMRRGRPAAWIRYGIPHAINIGDFLLVMTMAALTDPDASGLDDATRFRLVRLITQALDHTHVGQALDIGARGQRRFTIGEYLRIVREKTGHYLAAPTQGGAIVAGAPEPVLQAIGEMAQFLGPLFQIMDDIIDLTVGKGREAIGSDIREGKRSYLVAHAAECCTYDQADRMFQILDKPRDETAREDIQWIIKLFDTCGSVEAGRAICRELHEESKKVLARLPERLAARLGGVFESLATRMH